MSANEPRTAYWGGHVGGGGPITAGKEVNARIQIAAALYVDAGCKPSCYRMIAATLGMKYDAVAQMMRRPRLQSCVRQMLTAKFNQLELSSQRVMEELATISFANVKDIFDDQGDVYATHMLPDHVAAAIQAIEVEKRVDLTGPRGPKTEDDPNGGGEQTVTTKYKFHNKIEALKVLAQHFKIVGGADEGVNALASALADRLRDARKRAPNPQPIQDATIIETDDTPSPEEVLAQAGIPSQEIDDEEPIW